jgi:hypothetical protein
MITSSHSPLWETDYNFHKSNSTYFSDLDIARTHLITAMLKRGIRGVGTRPGEEATSWNVSTAIRYGDDAPKDKINPLGLSGVDSIGAKAVSLPSGRGMTEEEFVLAAKRPGNLLIALGSVACFFHREIAPYQRYEIWTRLLCWDKKWLYLVSYFVEAGAIAPEEYVLQPQNRWGKPRKPKARAGETAEQRQTRLRKKIFATSIATYVVKKGRLTIPPEVVLQRSGLLPEKPADAPSVFYVPPVSTATTPLNGSGNGSPIGSTAANSQVETASAADSEATLADEVYYPGSFVKGDDEWTWDIVEKERQRGLRFANVFDSMNSMRDDFDVEQKSVLGRYPDLFYGL